MMRLIISSLCLLVAMIATAQYSEPGYYRVHSAYSDGYISIKGTKYQKTTRPDAFWSCIKMVKDSALCSDPGSIIYIDGLEQTSLCSQGVSTYSLTGLYLDVLTANVMEDGKPTYVATTSYEALTCYFRDFGVGMSPGFNPSVRQAHWWIEPVNEQSMDTSYLGVKPANEKIKDANGWYWTSISCDFPFALPVNGGIEGAYTVKELEKADDGRFFVTALKVYGQGDTVPAATPILLKCKSPYASGNKVIPVKGIANNNKMPLYSDLLMGNYFSSFINHASYTDPAVTTEYIPSQATKAAACYMALGIDENGSLGFFPQAEGTYMAANTAWLSIESMKLEGVKAVYLVEETAQEPEAQVGDVNGDGNLNISDALMFINYLLNHVELGQVNINDGAPADFNATMADFNGDGTVNVSDVIDLINHLLNTI